MDLSKHHSHGSKFFFFQNELQQRPGPGPRRTSAKFQPVCVPHVSGTPSPVHGARMHKPEALLQDRLLGPLPRAVGPPHLPEPSRRRQARTLTEPGAGRDRGGRARQLRLSTAAASRPAAPLRAAARSAARSPAAAAAASPPWRGKAADRGLGGRLRWRRGPGVCAGCPRESLSAPHPPQPRSRRGLGCKALRHWPLRGGRWFADARRASPPPRAPPLRAPLRRGVLRALWGSPGNRTRQLSPSSPSTLSPT